MKDVRKFWMTNKKYIRIPILGQAKQKPPNLLRWWFLLLKKEEVFIKLRIVDDVRTRIVRQDRYVYMPDLSPAK